jgi:hypothetical protein
MSFLDCHDLVSRFNPDFTADENFMEFVYQNIPKDKEVIKGDGYVDVIPSDSPTIRVIPTFKDINPNELDIEKEINKSIETIMGSDINQVYLVYPKNSKFVKHIEIISTKLEKEYNHTYQIKAIPYSLKPIIKMLHKD